MRFSECDRSICLRSDETVVGEDNYQFGWLRTDRRADAVGVTRDGEAGLGPALNNKLLPAFVIRTQVRHGYGAMPAFYRNEISEAELESLIAYLKALRRHG